MQKLLQNVHHALFLENVFPQIACDVVLVGCGGIALAAVFASARRALVEGQEECRFAVELCGHVHVVQVDAEECEDTAVELEDDFARVAVVLPLQPCVGYTLASELVFQFEGDKRNAVHRKHHVHRFGTFGRIEPLPVAFDAVFLVKFRRKGVEVRFGLKIAYLECDAAVLEAVPQHRKHAVGGYRIGKTPAKRLFGVAGVLHGKAFPFLCLRLFYKREERAAVDAVGVVESARAFCVAAPLRN